MIVSPLRCYTKIFLLSLCYWYRPILLRADDRFCISILIVIIFHYLKCYTLFPMSLLPVFFTNSFNKTGVTLTHISLLLCFSLIHIFNVSIIHAPGTCVPAVMYLTYEFASTWMCFCSCIHQFFYIFTPHPPSFASNYFPKNCVSESFEYFIWYSFVSHWNVY